MFFLEICASWYHHGLGARMSSRLPSNLKAMRPLTLRTAIARVQAAPGLD